jgi:hypothetical protein
LFFIHLIKCPFRIPEPPSVNVRVETEFGIPADELHHALLAVEKGPSQYRYPNVLILKLLVTSSDELSRTLINVTHSPRGRNELRIEIVLSVTYLYREEQVSGYE